MTESYASKSETVRSSPLVRLGIALFHYRNAIFPVVFLVIVFLDQPRYPFGSSFLDRALDLTGILLAIAGQVLRVLVIGLAYIQRGGRAGKVYAEELVTDGLFAHSRNPLYVGNIMIFGGLFIILNSLAGWLVGIPLVLLAYWVIVLAEEDYLRRRFGAPYEQYCRDVNRFLPSLHGLRTTLASMQFAWGRVIRKEYGSTWTWLTAVLGLLLWERVAIEGFQSARTDVPRFVLVWVVITGLYVAARWLKKSRRL